MIHPYSFFFLGKLVIHIQLLDWLDIKVCRKRNTNHVWSLNKKKKNPIHNVFSLENPILLINFSIISSSLRFLISKFQFCVEMNSNTYVHIMSPTLTINVKLGHCYRPLLNKSFSFEIMSINCTLAWDLSVL